MKVTLMYADVNLVYCKCCGGVLGGGFSNQQTTEDFYCLPCLQDMYYILEQTSQNHKRSDVQYKLSRAYNLGRKQRTVGDWERFVKTISTILYTTFVD